MDDLISRQTAIDAVLSIGHIAKLTDGDAVIRMSAVNYVLRNLPSAEPEEDTIEMQEADIDEAMKLVRDARVTILPSAEPVIRCRDCKWSVEHYDTDGNVPYWICKNWDGGTDADGFCHEAERRQDESN